MNRGETVITGDVFSPKDLINFNFGGNQSSTIMERDKDLDDFVYSSGCDESRVLGSKKQPQIIEQEDSGLEKTQTMEEKLKETVR